MTDLEMLDTLQNAVIDDKAKKQLEKKEYHFDKLKMYFGEDCEVIPGVVISSPTIGDILQIGEDKFYHSLSPFLYNSTSIRLFLWERKIDWCNVRDIEVCAMLLHTIDKEPLRLIFKDISFDDFQCCELKENNKSETSNLVLYSESQNLIIPEDSYMTIAEYIREMMNIHPKVEKAKGKTAKSWMIQEDRMELQDKNKNDSSTLLPLVSACVNHPGFKYKLQELKDIGVYQFMDSVRRIQKYETSTAALKGIYSGFVDGKKIPDNTLNFMSDV